MLSSNPQKVYLDPKDRQTLTFDRKADIEPLTMTPPILNNEAQAMNAAVGDNFDIESFLSKHYRDKKSVAKARAVLAYLTRKVDDSTINFGSNGGIFYRQNLVPDADLVAVLQSLTNRKGKTLSQGEYFVLNSLAGAPPDILSAINPAKLKLCNIQFEYKTRGPPSSSKVPVSKPAKIPLPPSQTRDSNIVIRTANPFLYKPFPNLQPRTILKTKTQIMKPKLPASAVQKKFNAKPAPAWYKIL